MNRNYQYSLQPMVNKKCSRCGKTKPLSEFSKNASKKGGHNSVCRECTAVSGRQWYEANKELTRSRAREWRKENREGYGAAQKRHRAKYPEKIKARRVVQYAVHLGKLPRVASLKCFHCENQAQHYHHHKGYAKEHWLDVVPVCSPCHSALDNSQE